MRVLLLLVIAACAPAKPTGSCVLWTDCGEGGACEYSHPHAEDAGRYDCSFADGDCATGRRFGEFASADVAGECVDFSPGFDGRCDDDHACGDRLTCRAGRCVNVVRLDATAQATTATCSDRGATGGDVYVWGIAFLGEEPALFRPDSILADAMPYAPGAPYPTVEARTATVGANHLCIVGDGGLSECFGRVENPAVGITAGMGVWAFINPLGPHVAIAPSTLHTCGAKSRTVDCWGVNDDLQLDGIGAGGPAYAETTVDIGQDVTHITTGKAFSCAGTTTDVWCWGGTNNWTSDTFDGPRGTKARVRSDSIDPGPVTGLDAGEAHVCAIKDTQLWCWGVDDAGQVDGQISTVPVGPRKPLGDTPVRVVAAGAQHTCAVTEDERLLCWGSNSVGQLGSSTTSTAPGEVPLLGCPTEALSANDFTTCIVLEDSFIHCFGAPNLTTDVGLGVIAGEQLSLAQFVGCTL